MDILVLRILFPLKSESRDGVKEGNEGEEGMKNKEESQRRNAMKKEEMRNVKMAPRE